MLSSKPVIKRLIVTPRVVSNVISNTYSSHCRWKSTESFNDVVAGSDCFSTLGIEVRTVPSFHSIIIPFFFLTKFCIGIVILVMIQRKYGVDTNDLKSVYRSLMSQYHPDKHKMKEIEERDEMANKASIITNAYQTLKDPNSRALHLLELITGSSLDEQSSVRK